MSLGKYVIACIGIGVACLVLSHLLPGDGETFAQPASVAIARLQATQRVVEGTGLGSLTLKSAGTEQGNVLIMVTKAGTEGSGRCRVTISPASRQTSRAVTDCARLDSADEPLRRVAGDAMTIVVREHVGATIADRTYDIDRVANRMVALVVTNRAAMAASVRRNRE